MYRPSGAGSAYDIVLPSSSHAERPEGATLPRNSVSSESVTCALPLMNSAPPCAMVWLPLAVAVQPLKVQPLSVALL